MYHTLLYICIFVLIDGISFSGEMRITFHPFPQSFGILSCCTHTAADQNWKMSNLLQNQSFTPRIGTILELQWNKTNNSIKFIVLLYLNYTAHISMSQNYIKSRIRVPHNGIPE